MVKPSGDRWVVTLNVRLTDPLSERQQRSLERLLLAVNVRSSRIVRLSVAVDGVSLAAAIDRALELGREFLVTVDAWFERVDVFDARSRDHTRWRSCGGWMSGGDV